MAGIITRIAQTMRYLFAPCPRPSSGTLAYRRAKEHSRDLIELMNAEGDNAIRGIVSDMLQERHNALYATTIYEAHQEMISPLRQKANGAARRS